MMPTVPSAQPSEQLDSALIDLVEEFTRRAQRGEVLDPEEILRDHPEQAARLRPLLPAICGLVDLGGSGSLTRSAVAPAGLPDGSVLGDFLILRRLGQGGMGVVYEAVQTSLGRHVALKVLPTGGLTPSHLDRFHREAQAAARLHHSNIVPVFGVGEHRGVHYYAMQYIRGQGLDVVLRQVQQVRTGGPADAADGPGSFALARSLWGDAFPPAAGPETDPAARTVTQAATASGSALLPVELLAPSRRTYYRSVAKVGVQVAQALAYAHGQGVLHRDVKPSNLLLDAAGVVWVTDFGLAKVEGAGDLTHTGDVLGTLRYMAPERLRGGGDARSDVYSLGLTLYELLALRPAFADVHGSNLADLIERADPPRLRHLDSNVPRDLETIVLKAIDKEPRGRYASARDLADDLQRYVNDQPIRARPVRPWERAAKWARRHPAPALAAAAIATAAVALIGVLVWSNLKVSAALAESKTDKQKAEAEERRAVAAAGKEREARVEADRVRDLALAESYRATLGETRLLRVVRPPGWRGRAVDNLRRLVKADVPGRDVAALRAEALACLAYPDLTPVATFGDSRAGVADLDFSPDGKVLAGAAYRGQVILWGVPDGRELRRITDPGFTPALAAAGGSHHARVRFQPGGTRLAYTSWAPAVHLVDWADPGPVQLVAGPAAARSLAFDNSGGLLAVTWGGTRAILYDVGGPMANILNELQQGPQPSASVVALSRSGDLMVTGSQNTVRFTRTAPRRESAQRLGDGSVNAVAVSSDEQLVAAATGADRVATVFQVSENPINIYRHSILQGHTGALTALAFSPEGRMLASASMDQSVRLWDARSGECLVVVQPNRSVQVAVAFSPDGQYLATASPAITLYRVIPAAGAVHLPAPYHGQVTGLAVHPDQPLVVTTHGMNVTVWDTVSERRVRNWPGPATDPRTINYSAPAFAPGGKYLAASANDARYPGAVHLWDTGTGAVARTFAGQALFSGHGFDPVGRRLATVDADETGASVWDVESGDRVRRWPADRGRRWTDAVLFGETSLLLIDSGGGLSLADVGTGEVIARASVRAGPTGHPGLVVSPDGKHVAVALDQALHVLTLPDLRPVTTLDAPNPRAFRATAFSPDGRLLATAGGGPAMALWSTRTWERLASLPDEPQSVNAVGFLSDGRLVIGGAYDRVTIYDLAAVRAQLAELGIDWVDRLLAD
jgi:WD40 repeat protein/serine/threonine protein kinase